MCLIGYGISTVTKTYNEPTAIHHHSSFLGYTNIDTSHMCRVFLNLFRALGKARVRVNEFQVILRNSFLPDYAFDLPDRVKPVVGPLLANLKTLFLDLDANPAVYLDEDNIDCTSYYFRQFLADTPNLEHLRLNFRGHLWHDGSNRLNAFLAWLSRPAGSGLAPSPSQPLLVCPPPVDFPKLRQLDIGMAKLPPETILGIFKKFRLTLHTISLHKVTLRDHDERKITDRVNTWSKLFLHTADMKLHLTSINLSLLSQELTENKGPQWLSFKDGIKDRSVWNWNGVDMQSGLRDLQTAMVVDWKAFDIKDDDGWDSDDGMLTLFSSSIFSDVQICRGTLADCPVVLMDDALDTDSDEDHESEDLELEDHDNSEDD